MTFKDNAARAAVSQWNILGEVASYHQIGGVVSTLQAIIDEDTEEYPSGFESSTPQNRIQISLLTADAPRIKAGELIVTDDDTFELLDLVRTAGAVIVYTARKIDG